MKGHNMYQLWAIIFLIFTLNNLSEAKHAKKLPSAVVVGTVYCDTCFHQSVSKASHFISGALVAVECADSKSRKSFRKEVKTNEHGEFEVLLPFSVSKHVKKIKRCSVKLISSSEPYCSVASTATSTSSSLHLKSRKEGKHIFSAGFFTFKPLNQPELCDQKPSIRNNYAENFNDPAYLPPIQEPPTSNLPPISQDLPPLPQLPTLPPLPKLPSLPPLLPGFPLLPPKDKKTSQESQQKVTTTQFFGPNPFQPPIIPPNPLQPPPSLLPPVIPAPPPSIFPPFFPSPPPSVFPPVFPSPPPSVFPPVLPLPPPSPLIPFPSIPGITPSPPPPPPPIFQFPLPPFPFQPIPGFPGVPPATPTSKKTSP